MKRIYKIKTKMTSRVCEIKGINNDFFSPDELKSIIKSNISYGLGNDKYIIVTNVKNKIIGIEQVHDSADAITTAIKANAAGIVTVITLPYCTTLKESYERRKDIPCFSFHNDILKMCELFQIDWVDTIALDSNLNCVAFKEV